MTTNVPPVPPASRSNKGPASDPKKDRENDASAQHEHHANSAEKGETANIKQNTTNKGYFQGRRVK
jgi:hypothetical protein